MTEATRDAIAKARQDFLALVGSVRPELHRYAARLTGSVIDGEDIVQETLAKAFYALSLAPEVPPLRPWGFAVRPNGALDFLKGPGPQYPGPWGGAEENGAFDERPEPAA